MPNKPKSTEEAYRAGLQSTCTQTRIKCHEAILEFGRVLANDQTLTQVHYYEIMAIQQLLHEVALQVRDLTDEME